MSFSDLSIAVRHNFALALGADWDDVCLHCFIEPDDIRSTCDGKQSQRFCEVLRERCISLEIVTQALKTVPRIDVLSEFESIFASAAPFVVPRVTTTATFDDISHVLKEKMAEELGQNWQGVAANLGVAPATIKTHLDAKRYVRTDRNYAWVLIRWMAQNKIAIRTGLQAISDAGRLDFVTKFGPLLNDVGTLVTRCQRPMVMC